MTLQLNVATRDYMLEGLIFFNLTAMTGPRICCLFSRFSSVVDVSLRNKFIDLMSGMDRMG